MFLVIASANLAQLAHKPHASKRSITEEVHFKHISIKNAPSRGCVISWKEKGLYDKSLIHKERF